MNKSTIKISSLFLVVLLICTIAFLFTSCNKQDDNSSSVKDLYIIGTSFDEDAQIMYITIGFSGLDEKKLNIDNAAVFSSTTTTDTAFYYVTDTTIKMNGVAISSAVNSMLTQDEKIYNGMEYSSLKVRLQYATIYKSIKSEGTISKSGKYYLHLFDINEVEELDVRLSIKQQNSATWYGTLAGCSVGILLIVGALVLWRKKHGKKQEREINKSSSI